MAPLAPPLSFATNGLQKYEVDGCAGVWSVVSVITSMSPFSHRCLAPDIFMTCASSRHEYSAEDRVRSVSIIMDGD